MKRGIIVALCGAVVSTMLVAGPAEAWKPPSHFFAAEQARFDALDDGLVSIRDVRNGPAIGISVHPVVREAIERFPLAYRAGTIGPDIYPDMYVGAAQIHVDTVTHNDTEPPNLERTSQAFEWGDHLWEQAWKPTANPDDRLRNIAFATGYVGGHMNGDVWAHTWVNSYAGGVFPDITDLEQGDIPVRHFIVEGYADKHRPGFETGQPFTFEAPHDFVSETMILSGFARANSHSPLLDFFHNLSDGLEHRRARLQFDNTHQDCFGGLNCEEVQSPDGPVLVCTGFPCAADPTDSPINLIELGIDVLLKLYVDRWIEDIDIGLREWPKLSEAIGREIYAGKLKPDPAPVRAAFKDFILNHLLSMFGVPDFVGEGIFLVSEVIGFLTELVETGLRFVFDLLREVPILGEILDFVIGLYDKAKQFVQDAVQPLVDRVEGFLITDALGLRNLPPEAFDAIERDDDADDKITLDEVVAIIKEPEEFIEHPAIFPPGTRAKVDAEMHLGPGVDIDGDPDDPFQIESFRDYNPDLFAPLRNTIELAKLAMLDHNGLNTLVRAHAGPGLPDLYGPRDNDSGNWFVPNNVMLGWAKSLDAEYQWRVNSPNDGRSYGTGTMLLFEDCVARQKVFKRTFLQPVEGIDAFGDSGDPPSPILDATPPASAIAVSGPFASAGGETFVSGSTLIGIFSTDNLWTKPEIRVRVRTFDTGSPAPEYGPAVPADPAPFTLPAPDGPKTVQFHAIDGNGSCNSEAEQTAHFTLDASGPVLTVVSPSQPSYPSDAILPLEFNATDAAGADPDTARHFVDGVERTPVPTSIDLFDLPPGVHTYRAEQSDVLGNASSVEASWTTVVTQDSLAGNLDTAFERGCITTRGTYDSLRAKLDAAKASDARGNDGASDNQLEAFKNELRAKKGRTVGADCAAALTTNATALQAA